MFHNSYLPNLEVPWLLACMVFFMDSGLTLTTTMLYSSIAWQAARHR